MSKSGLTIHKEMQKKLYQESELGKVEREITKIYDNLTLKKQQLPEEISKKIFDIRDENEKWQLEYIERTNREHREAVDAKLLESMSKELDILKQHGL
jgi:hypothetical protein